LSDTENELKKAYRRGFIGLAAAAIVWSVAYFVARKQGWSETTLLIPAVSAVLSGLCYWRYRQMN
jgi:predicted exporter